MRLDLNAVFLKVPEGYIGLVEELPGTNVQEATLEEARETLKEAVRDIIAVEQELSRTDASAGDARSCREISESPARTG